MKNKLLLIITILLFVFISKEIYKEFYNKQKEKIIIEEIIEKKEVTKTLENKGEHFKLSVNYLGYIEIQDLKIKSLIMLGTTDSILNKNVVGMYKTSMDIDDLYGNIILAGHNNKYVFKNLLKIKENDIIKLVTHQNIYHFKVVNIDIINIDNYDYFKEIEDIKILTLITCYNKLQRFIVVAEQI